MSDVRGFMGRTVWGVCSQDQRGTKVETWTLLGRCQSGGQFLKNKILYTMCYPDSVTIFSHFQPDRPSVSELKKTKNIYISQYLEL